MGPCHPADSQSHAGSLGHQFQSNLETPAKLPPLNHFFFFQKETFSAISTLTIPVLNLLQGGIHLLDDPAHSDLIQLGLLCTLWSCIKLNPHIGAAEGNPVVPAHLQQVAIPLRTTPSPSSWIKGQDKTMCIHVSHPTAILLLSLWLSEPSLLQGESNKTENKNVENSMAPQ